MTDTSGRSGCWLWTGGCSGDGYGAFALTSEDNELIGHALGKADPARANRVAFLISNGRLPEGALHVCDMPKCVNPEHIIDGSHAFNMKMRSRDYQKSTSHVPHETIRLLKYWHSRGVQVFDLAQAVQMRERIVRAVLDLPDAA